MADITGTLLPTRRHRHRSDQRRIDRDADRGGLGANAYADETAPNWIDGQHRAFVAFGGVPKVAVPDNPEALVAKADRYEPKLTAVYRVSPALPRHRDPRASAQAEGQGRGRGRGEGGRDAHPRGCPRSHICVAGRAQYVARRRVDGVECGAVPEARGLAQQVVAGRASAPVGAAGNALSDRYLPRARWRATIASTCSGSTTACRTSFRGRSRGAADADARRDIAAGSTSCAASTGQPLPALRDRDRSCPHADASPRICIPKDHAARRCIWHRHRGVDRDLVRQATPSRTSHPRRPGRASWHWRAIKARRRSNQPAPRHERDTIGYEHVRRLLLSANPTDQPHYRQAQKDVPKH